MLKSLIIFIFMNTVFGLGRWELIGCDLQDTDSDSDSDSGQGAEPASEAFERALKDAHVMIKTAQRVFADDYPRNADVKGLVEHAIHPIDVASQINYLQGYLDDLSLYEDEPVSSGTLGPIDNKDRTSDSGDNHDTYVICHMDELEETEDEWYEDMSDAELPELVIHPYSRVALLELEVSAINVCMRNPDDHTAAHTLVTQILDQTENSAAMDEWQADLRHRPSYFDHILESPDKPNSIHICKSKSRPYKKNEIQDQQNFIKDGADGRVVSSEHLERLIAVEQSGESAFRLIDYLLASVTGTFIHELTHTTLGGLAVDIPKGDCYEWNQITRDRVVHNADSITLVVVSLWLWDQGYLVNHEGQVVPLAGNGGGEDEDGDTDMSG